MTRRTRVLLLLANFGPFVAIIVTAFLAYAMEQWGVGPDVIGKVPQVRAMRVAVGALTGPHTREWNVT